MDPVKLLTDTKQKLSQSLERFENSLKTLRTGRANASMLESVVVEVYGIMMPLNQVASVTAPEAQLLQITPFDPNNLGAISMAIRNNPTLGLNPADDGWVIRVPIPPLNEERRRELAKQIGSKQEEHMITVRNIRREAMNDIETAKKNKELGEDEAKRYIKQIEELINETHLKIEKASKAKEVEIMTV